ncbi:hypothetical protein EBX93_02530, partial [bacterium]|nr:hypothetical protein [bacterium]
EEAAHPRQQTDAMPEELKKYDPKQIHEFKSLAKALGFVAKEDMEQFDAEKQKQTIVNNFFASHPEYTVEKDPEGTLYNVLRNELSMYRTETPETLRKALERAHDAIRVTTEGAKAQAKSLADKARIKAASVGSGGGKTAG